MKKFILLHSHKHGYDVYAFTSNSTLNGLTDNRNSVAEILKVEIDEAVDEIFFFELPDDVELPNVTL
jgi:hypothetical protein